MTIVIPKESIHRKYVESSLMHWNQKMGRALDTGYHIVDEEEKNLEIEKNYLIDEILAGISQMWKNNEIPDTFTGNAVSILSNGLKILRDIEKDKLNLSETGSK